MVIVPQYIIDLARLAQIELLRKNPIGHDHCPKCGHCMLDGQQIHAQCVSEVEYSRIIREFNSMARSH